MKGISLINSLEKDILKNNNVIENISENIGRNSKEIEILNKNISKINKDEILKSDLYRQIEENEISNIKKTISNLEIKKKILEVLIFIYTRIWIRKWYQILLKSKDWFEKVWNQ